MILHEFQAHGSFIPPLIYEQFDPARLKAWFRASRPDAIIARDDELGLRYAQALGLTIGGPIAIAGVSVGENSGWAGIDELPGEVGASAVDRLIAMIEQGERDLPRRPTMTLVRGLWRDGPSCRARPVRSRCSGDHESEEGAQTGGKTCRDRLSAKRERKA